MAEYIREALCWNFEDDNFTWFDASHDTELVASNYNPNSYLNGLKGIGANAIWAMSEPVGATTAVDENGVFNFVYSGNVTHGKPSYLDDNRTSTLMMGNATIYSGVNAGPGGLGLITSLNFSCGFITGVTTVLNRVLYHLYSNISGFHAAVKMYLSKTQIKIEILSDDGTVQLTNTINGTFNSGDVFILDVDMTSAGVYAYTVYRNFVPVGTNSGDLPGVYTLGISAEGLFGSQTGNNEFVTQQYWWYKAGGGTTADWAALKTAYDKNFQSYPSDPTGTSVLDSAVCMKYQPDTGWQVRWADLITQGKSWTNLQNEGTTWRDFSSGNAEENIYWLTRSGVLIGDQVVKTNGIKEYFVERIHIDLNDVVQQFTTDQWIHAKQIYFHLRSQREIGDVANPFGIAVGWADTLMDDPVYPVPAEINLQRRSVGGKVKYDFRSTGRYLALKMTFNGTQEIQMTGCEIDVEQLYGR